MSKIKSKIATKVIGDRDVLDMFHDVLGTKSSSLAITYPKYHRIVARVGDRYVAIGWGDRGFYVDTPTWADLKLSTLCNALFVPSESVLLSGGPAHGVQLWVNLPAAQKFTPPRYQAITGDHLTLLTSDDGSALIRLIAGDLAGRTGPGVTHTPISYAHVTLPPGGRLVVPWNPAFNAMAYALLGQGYAGDEERPFREHELVMFGGGDHLVVRAAEHQEDESPTVELLLLGGLPIGEPIAHYGPFVMNSKAEIIQALEDYEAGRMGTIPAVTLGE